jgi:prepilin-type N-terminal cleavage/methylation domain-containing protein
MNRQGFTLLEVLAAMAVLIVVLAIVYSTFDAVTKTMEIGRAEAETLRKQQFLLRTLRSGLESASAYAPPDSDRIIFEGEDGSDSEGAADTLTFLATAPPRGGAGLPGDLTQIQFIVTGADTDDDAYTSGDGTQSNEELTDLMGRTLLISQVPLLTVAANVDQDALLDAAKNNPDRLEELEDLASDLPFEVQSVNIDYYDGSLDEWFDDWSFDERQRLPWAVRVRILFPRTEEERAADQQAGLDPEEDPDVEVFVAFQPGLGLFDDSMPLLELLQ